MFVKKHVLILLFMCIGNYLLYAQKDSLSESEHLTKKLALCLSYYGKAFVQPGYKIGLEYELWTKEKSRVRQNGTTIDKKHAFFIGEHLSNYYHRRNHSGLFLHTEIGYRGTRKKGFFYEVSTGVGYYHSFLMGDTYTVSDGGDVDRIPLAGNPGLGALFSVGIGKDCSFKSNLPWGWHMRYVELLKYPFGTSYINYSVIEIGIKYYLK